MQQAAILLASFMTPAMGLHEHTAPFLQNELGLCVPPGTCTPPNSRYQRVIPGPRPGQQWNINGGFCGSWSTQQSALAFGAWISQDLVRKANRDQTGIQHFMHGDKTVGYEVMPTNVGYTAEHLKLKYDEWDYTQPSPQATKYKQWLKTHLVQGHPIVWFPLCKGDSHVCYPFSCPNGGACDHVEPMFGIFSNHSLTDLTVYDDDVILHASDQDLMPYYRPMSSLQDDTSMAGNCLNAGSGFGKNEMYPCFYQDVTYGLAVTGLAVSGSLPLSLVVDIDEEPDVRQGAKPAQVHGKVTVTGLTSGSSYTLFRFNSTEALPAAPPFAPTAESSLDFVPSSQSWTYADPMPFFSDTAVYYVAAPKA